MSKGLFGAFGFDSHEIHALSSIEGKVRTTLWNLKQVDEHPERVRLILLLVMKPTSKVAKEVVLPNIEYYHHRSGEHCDLFLVGYNRYDPRWVPLVFDHDKHWLDQRDPKDLPAIRKLDEENTVGNIGGWPVKFDPVNFNNSIYRLEDEIHWTYTGRSDLIVANAFYRPEDHTTALDFSSAVVCNLETMLEEQTIRSVEELLESAFAFARTSTGSDLTWGFSDQLGVKTVRSALSRLVLSLLPKKVGDDIRKLSFFAVSDLRKNG